MLFQVIYKSVHILSTNYASANVKPIKEFYPNKLLHKNSTNFNSKNDAMIKSLDYYSWEKEKKCTSNLNRHLILFGTLTREKKV